LHDPQLPPLQPGPQLHPPVPATAVLVPPLPLLNAANVERQRLLSDRWQVGHAVGSSAWPKLRRSSNFTSHAGHLYS
jgi:hypothetical protein